MELRKRNPVAAAEKGDDSESSDTAPFLFKMPRSSQEMPSAQDLLELKPAKAGYCEKKNNSIFIQCFPCCFKLWKPRYFVLIGNFLYRYSSETGESPKGGKCVVCDVWRVACD